MRRKSADTCRYNQYQMEELKRQLKRLETKLKAEYNKFEVSYLQDNRQIPVQRLQTIDSVLETEHRNGPLEHQAQPYPIIDFMDKIKKVKKDTRVQQISSKLGSIEWAVTNHKKQIAMQFQGPYIYLDDSIYYGEYEDGLRNGKGWLYQDGILYEGNFKSDLRNGKGRMFDSLYNCYDGMWMNGKLDGQGTILNLQGHLFNGQFLMNLKNGIGKEQFVNGFCYKGQYLLGKMDGMCEISFGGDRYFKGEFYKDMIYEGMFQFDKTIKYYGKWSGNMPDGNGRFVIKDQINREVVVDVEMKNGKVKGCKEEFQQYQNRIDGLDYSKLNKDIQYIISNQINLVVDTNSNLNFQQEFDEFIDVKEPYYFGDIRTKKGIVVDYDMIDQNQLNDFVIQEEMDMRNSSYNFKQVQKNEKNCKSYRFIEKQLNLNKNNNHRLLIEQRDEILDLYQKNQIKNIQLINEYKIYLIDNAEENEKISKYINNEVYLRNILIKTKSIHTFNTLAKSKSTQSQALQTGNQK